MSVPSISGFLAVIESIRNRPQPYSALSDYLASIVVLPRWKGGVKVLPFATIVLNLLLLSAAVATCVIKIRCKTFHLGFINQDHILRPNSAVCWALGCIVYTLMSLVETGVWISGNEVEGIDNTRGRVALAGIKFTFVWMGAWCFSWSSAGHYICCKWRPPWQPAHRHSKIPVLVVWCLNTTFVLTASVALLLPMITFTMVELQARDILNSVALVCKKLRHIDKHRVVKFDLLRAMPILSPLLQALPRLSHIIKLMRLGILAWFCVVCLVISAQMIFICLAFLQRRVLGSKHSLWTTLVRIVVYKADTGLDSASRSAIAHSREQNVIMMISFIILVTGIAFLPVVVWQYRTVTLEHMSGVTGQLMTDLISTFVVSMIANVVMLAIILQTIRLSPSKTRKGTVGAVSSDDFPMKFRNYQPAESPEENKAHQDSRLSLEESRDISVTGYDKWQQDKPTIDINQTDELSEISVDERRPSVV